MSFKWKPPEENTIDFLVQIKQDNGNLSLNTTKYSLHNNKKKLNLCALFNFLKRLMTMAKIRAPKKIQKSMGSCFTLDSS